MRSTILIVAAFALGVAPARAERPADFEAAFEAEARRRGFRVCGFLGRARPSVLRCHPRRRLELCFVPRQRPERGR